MIFLEFREDANVKCSEGCENMFPVKWWFHREPKGALHVGSFYVINFMLYSFVANKDEVFESFMMNGHTKYLDLMSHKKN